MGALDLLSGDSRAFVEKVWGCRVHLHHADPGELVGLLALDDVDHLLTSTALRTPAVRVAQDGAVLPASRFTRQASLAGQALTGLVDGRRLLDLFEGGATVVLQGLHRYWPPLTRLVRDLELALGHPCQANAYLTPPGSQGFAVHSDTHDVFVFQTHGTKLWEVHGGPEGGPPEEVLLEPGLSMYLPAGTPHAARAQETASLHVTVGINQLTWRRLLTDRLAAVLQDPRYDARLPAGYPTRPDALTDDLAAHLRALADDLAALDPGALAAEEAAAFLRTRTPALRGGLQDRLALPRLGDDTVLARRPTAACALREDGDRLRVLLGDRELRMPVRLRAAMERVADADRLRPRDLAPWLDEQSRLVLARRLVREGLLRVEE